MLHMTTFFEELYSVCRIRLFGFLQWKCFGFFPQNGSYPQWEFL